jgi:hypothetical protein
VTELLFAELILLFMDSKVVADGLLLGISRKLVTPPAAAALLPLPISSFSD